MSTKHDPHGWPATPTALTRRALLARAGGFAAAAATLPLARAFVTPAAGATAQSAPRGLQAIERGAADYESRRQGAVWQALKPARYPDVIIEARTGTDAVEALRYARSRGLTVAVKGGGHNYTGTCLRDGGMLLDVGALRSVEIDAAARRVRVQPGIRALEFATLLGERNLAFPVPHVSTVPMGGFLLGGGMGWNGEHWGQFACFRVRAVEVVTAAGERLTIGPAAHPDLYWAARGAGPAFCAVATAFHLEAFPMPRSMQSSTYLFALEYAEQAAAWLRGLAAGPHADLELTLVFENGPPGDGRGEVRRSCIASVTCFAADADAARVALGAVARSAPRTDALAFTEYAPVTWADLYLTSSTQVPRRLAADNAWSDDPLGVVRVLAREFARAPSTRSVAFANFRGPAALPVDAAFSVAGSTYALWMASWDDAAADAVNLRWVEDLARELDPLTLGCYINETDVLRRPGRARRCYSESAWTRLQATRERYDPRGTLPPAFGPGTAMPR